MKKDFLTKNYFGKYPSVELLPKERLDKELAKFKKTFVNFVKSLPQNAKILEAGCGKGKSARVIMAYRPDVKIFAIDKSNVQDFLPPEVKFQIASVESAGELFKENFFDVIICQHVVEHLLYPMTMMENFKKVLKNDGRLYLETPNWTNALFPFFPRFFWHDYSHVRIFTKQTMKRLFDDYGFEVEAIKTVSSSGFIVQDDSIKKVKSVYQKENASIGKFFVKIVKTGFIRVINPFLKDLLIGIAINKK